MTDGEITFHLREIVGHWTAPRITSGTAAELERLKLIEFSEDRRLVRLTPDGVQRKITGRLAPEDSTNRSAPRRQQKQGKGRRRQFSNSRPRR
jgi:hypothetical protein